MVTHLPAKSVFTLLPDGRLNPSEDPPQSFCLYDNVIIFDSLWNYLLRNFLRLTLKTYLYRLEVCMLYMSVNIVLYIFSKVPSCLVRKMHVDK